MTWGKQFIQACMLHPTKNAEGEIEEISTMDAIFHLGTIGWKLLFSFVPPAHVGGGWPCFWVSLVFIGMVTAIVGEFATLFGCALGLLPSVTAITFVALGTSLPDTFASMAAAKAEKFADSAVGNVTGSNSVNVFLGLGLPWVIATIYEGKNNRPYYVPAGSLGFSVAIFVVCAVTCIITLLVRRKVVGGELGGENFGRYGSCLFLVLLWILYIVLCTLQAYGHLGKDLSFGIDLKVLHPNPKCNI
jgi:solute carrier family 8 (sodium/calcium exchanger)